MNLNHRFSLWGRIKSFLWTFLCKKMCWRF